jgi:hypothetical protein
MTNYAIRCFSDSQNVERLLTTSLLIPNSGAKSTKAFKPAPLSGFVLGKQLSSSIISLTLFSQGILHGKAHRVPIEKPKAVVKQ